MSDSVCSIIAIACLDVCAGFCVDFTSLRHSFTENLCNCSCCCCRKPEDDDDESGEREPLINGQKPQPNVHEAQVPPQPPMQVRR
ncbi:hypothetical protein C8R45DRAFT_279588 [Mycena sanguinolenta]|nr:hypothetical protein C8R45DRAFT_279588 [Mycena sanguinolenta]